MIMKQLSVFLENKAGRLAEVTKMIAKQNVDILAMSIADTTDFGILRLIVSDVDKTASALKEDGLAFKITNVIAIAVPDKPGGLANALDVIESKGIGVEYMYAFIGKGGDEANVLIKVDEPDRAIDILNNEGIKLLTSVT